MEKCLTGDREGRGGRGMQEMKVSGMGWTRRGEESRRMRRRERRRERETPERTGGLSTAGSVGGKSAWDVF